MTPACRSLIVRAAISAASVWGQSSAFAGDRHHGYSPRYGGSNYGSYYGSSYYSNYSYTNPYLNPYSYESQALPYWLKSGYRSGGYTYSAPAARPDRFGAIAYSRSIGTYGYSFNQYSQAEAEQEALKQCDASDREVIGWMRNSYGALAIGNDVDQYGWAWATTRDAAQQAALANCRERTTNCRIAVTVFSGN